MTYRLPDDIKHAINTMRDPYPYIKPNPKWKAYNYNRKKFRKHGFWLSVCWDLDWAVILYITAAVSIDNPTAVDEDGDYSIKGQYYPAGISDLQEGLSEYLADAFLNSPYYNDTSKYLRFVYSCHLTSTDEEGGFDNDGLLVTILNGDNYEYITVDETDLCCVRNTYDVIQAIVQAAKAKPLEKATLTLDAIDYYNALASHVEDGIELSDIELKFLERELKQ